MEEIVAECKNFTNKKVVTCKKLQSLLAKLLYVAKIVAQLEPFKSYVMVPQKY